MIGTNRTHRKSGRGLLIGLASVVILYVVDWLSAVEIEGEWAPVVVLLPPLIEYVFRILRGAAWFPLGDEPAA